MPFVIHTLSDRVHDYLRDRIISHEIAPGESIRQDALALELGVSKIPIREALSRLVESNMVEAMANRGFIATPLSLDELEEVYALRLILEPELASRTATAATMQQREQVKAARDAVVSAGAGQKDNITLRRNTLLSVLHQPGRKTTMQIVLQIFDRAERYQPKIFEHANFDIANLKALVSAWLKGDGVRVQTLYQERLERRLDLLRAGLAT
jgi:DNA-binding GntR family transcriptional regulator